MRAYKYVNWVRERKRSRSGVKNATTSHDVHAHVCCIPWPNVCPCHRTFPSTSSAWEAGGPIAHLVEEGGGVGEGKES